MKLIGPLALSGELLQLYPAGLNLEKLKPSPHPAF